MSDSNAHHWKGNTKATWQDTFSWQVELNSAA